MSAPLPIRTERRSAKVLRRIALGGASLGLAATLAVAGSVNAQASPPGFNRNPDAQAKQAGISAGGGGYAGWAMKSQLSKSTASSMQTTPMATTSTTVDGMDVASYQGDVEWPTWYSRGVRFAYVKATEGTSYTNPYFNSQYTGSAKAGMIRGAYAFGRPDGASGAAQAKYFIAHGGGWTADGKTLPGALDMEQNYTDSSKPCYGKTPAQMLTWMKSFTTYYWSKLHRHIPIYTNISFWKTCVGNTTHYGTTNPLWIAYYGKTLPAMPGGWNYETIWQYSGSGAADLDRFSSGLTQLKKLATAKNS
ncbi:hypothetical protein GCM10011575_26980 [Microlunatus endophyticus]|uniref:Lysozyme n=1 Tax=Microlunatus endophyticus TaxID=1716077 RepID=A0A917SA44_9ACTN|nr:hypothetical protein GCM10011575_26980 [Microlunatus endophyticus]